jgi:hypothetical protein
MFVENTATVTCSSQDNVNNVFNSADGISDIFSVAATITDVCTPDEQSSPGTITWTIQICNTSPDGKSNLGIDTSGTIQRCDADGTNCSSPVPADEKFIAEDLAAGECIQFDVVRDGLDDGKYIDVITGQASMQAGQLPLEAMDMCTVTTSDGEGCTPGFWRNNLAKNLPNGAWAVDHHDLFSTTFGGNDPELKSSFREATHKGGQGKGNVLDGQHLAFAIWAQGGGDNALARHAVAALLNSASPDVAYSLSTSAIIALVSNALNSGDPSEVNAAKSILAGFNEDGCSINNDGTPKTDE